MAKVVHFILIAIFIGILGSVGCIAGTHTSQPVATDNQTNISHSSVPADNESIQTKPSGAESSTNTAVQSENSGDPVEKDLQSTVLIFSTNQLEMEQAKNNFGDGIELLKPILSGRQVTNYPDIFRRSWVQGSGVIIDKNGYILQIDA